MPSPSGHGKLVMLRLRLHTSQVAHQAGAYPGFYSMRRLGVFLLPPGRDTGSSQVYPQHYIRRYPIIHLGGERHRESKMSCSRTQHNVPARARTRTARSGAERTDHEATTLPGRTKGVLLVR